jgi:hypothetical protein
MLTINGFTEEFESLVLKAAQEPDSADLVFETEAELEKYFKA